MSEDVGNLQAGATDDEEAKQVVVAPTEEVEDGELGPELIAEGGQSEEEAKEEPDAKQEDWDKDRQARDQIHSAEQKVADARYEALNAKLDQAHTQIEQLQTTKPAEAALEEEPELTEDSEADAIVKRLNKLSKESGKAVELAEEITALKKDIAEKDDLAAQQVAKAGLKTTIGTLEQEFGAKYSGEAQSRAQKYFADKGYDQENPPPDASLDLALEKFFREVRDEDPNRKTPAETIPSVTLDTGTGGSKIKEPQRPMSNSEYRESLESQGKL